MNFASDNWAGVAPAIAESLSRHSTGFSPAYGESELDKRLEERFNDLFERQVAVFFVGTGTAANSLALSALNRPGGFVMCHRYAHVIEDECGAPEFFTSGARLAPVDGPWGKICPNQLAKDLDRFDPSFVHHGQPMAVSVTQPTEFGTIYDLDELGRIAEVTHKHSLSLHMDGARFANALVQLDVSPADMTWRSGVDVLSFGGTKNGCWCAEALVFFNPDQAVQLPFIRKRAAQLFSKTRFIAAQFHAYLDDNRWLALARHANQIASQLASVLAVHPEIRLAIPPQANEIFVVMPKTLAGKLETQGVKFYPWPTTTDVEPEIGDGQAMYRFVTSFANEFDEVERLELLLT